MKKLVLVVAAHADDEALGCGGTLAKHAAEGDEVHVVFMADGVGARDGAHEEALRARTEAMERALKALGVCDWHAIGLPDNQMDGLPLLQVVRPLEKIIAKLAPHTIYTHHHGDLNIDHRITHQAVMTACRPLPGSSCREIFSFEVMSSTEWAGPGQAAFEPNVFVDISAYWRCKHQALEAYALEMHPPPHSRSIAHLDALAQHRGACIGAKHAEAFMLIRMLR